MTSDAVVVPGGTPIGDALGKWPLCELVPLLARAAMLGKPVAFVGTGTERLLREESKGLIAKEIAPLVARWTVRCSHDRDRLVEYGVPAEAVSATADLAWMLDEVSAEPGRRYLSRLGIHANAPVVGINVNAEHAVTDRQPRLLGHIAEFLDKIVEANGVRIIFLCNEVRNGDIFDLAASHRVIAMMKRKERATVIPNEYWSPQFMMSLIACCDFTLSTRYHFCLFSALQNVPFVAVMRSGKVSDLCDDLGWRYGVGLQEISSDLLYVSFTEMDRQRADLTQHLRAAKLKMRERSSGNLIALNALKGRLGGARIGS